MIVEAMLTSCAGAYVDAEAMHRVFVGAWVTSVTVPDGSGGLVSQPR